MKIFWKILFTLFALGAVIAICSSSLNSDLTIIQIDGELRFVDKYNPDARVCIPAAYTDLEGEIEGEYRINGRTYGSKSLSERTSIHPTKGLIIGKKWNSDNGFQQHVLVKNGVARKFRDERKFRRRALCCDSSDPGKLFIVETKRRMTMNEFATALTEHCTNAVNLDMGRWGYGWVGNKQLSLWAYFFKDWQTSWLCCN